MLNKIIFFSIVSLFFSFSETIAFGLSTSHVIASQQPVERKLDDLLRQGRKYAENKDYQKAINAYKEASILDKNNAKIYSGIAYLYTQQKNYQAAAQYYRKALSIDLSNADFYYALGHSLANIGDNDNAATAYYYAVQLNPKSVKSYIGLGVVLLRKEDYDGAAEAYKRVIALDPNNPNIFSIMGSSLLQQKEFKQAVKYLKNAVKQFPRNTELRLLLATALLQEGQIYSGKKELRIAEKIDPRNLKIQLKIAGILEVQNNLEEALKIYKRISYFNHKYSEAYMGIGRIQLAQKDFLGATITYTDLINIIPQNPLPYYYLGLTFKERERIKEAETALKEALQLYQKYDNANGIQKTNELLKQLNKF
ncbi:MAG: tetratricopeptide repeat protein [Candidatus Atelocyanobacterium thalassa]|uniref:Flp pilus assembly protein TadD n=1 Tax=Candidatus Atelocyanobacterium thalassa isolate SIO64986 TaxID=1527444 RepID=A0A086CIG4_9CHRO|nr:MAG: Flp pilus assembly protein TadD [Candidatus Atelocyanobacterium thalassa isolate SIO64986]